MSTTSGFTTSTLEAIHSAFNNNLKYYSTSFGPSKIVLFSFLGNPNYSGLNISTDQLPLVYAGLAQSLFSFIADVSNNSVPNYNLGVISKFRILITIADGTVFFDSAKGANNTYANFLSKSINENHATRHYIQQSFHAKNGIGFESKWSSSTQSVDTYYSTRVGMSETGAIGVIAFSYSNSY